MSYSSNTSLSAHPSRLTYVEQQIVSLIGELNVQETQSDVDIRRQVKRYGLVDRMRQIMQEDSELDEDARYHSPLLRRGEKAVFGGADTDFSGVPVVPGLNVTKGSKWLKYTPARRREVVGVGHADNADSTKAAGVSGGGTPISDYFATVAKSDTKVSQRFSYDPFSAAQYGPRLLGTASSEMRPTTVLKPPPVPGGSRSNKLKPLPALPINEEPLKPSEILNNLLEARRSAQISDRARKVLSVVAEVIDQDDTPPLPAELGGSNTFSTSSAKNTGNGIHVPTAPTSTSTVVIRPDTNTTLKAAVDTRKTMAGLGRSLSLANGSRSTGSVFDLATRRPPRRIGGDAESLSYGDYKENRSAVVIGRSMSMENSSSSLPVKGRVAASANRPMHYRNASLSGLQQRTCTGQGGF